MTFTKCQINKKKGRTKKNEKKVEMVFGKRFDICLRNDAFLM